MKIDPNRRLDAFTMKVQGGMLEALGINMYSTLGKCLVEFIANAYDADASKVEIKIPFGEIEPARKKIRDDAKKEVADGTRKKFTLLTLPLPEDLEVVIRDDGHGMCPVDIDDKFLPFNRNRRWDAEKGEDTFLRSENGRRMVMGKKGLGKLAGFGAAEVVSIRTKRKGSTFSTGFMLDYNDLKQREDLSGVPIQPEYVDGLPAADHWTEIRLARLKCDAVKYGETTLNNVVADNFFGIEPADFSIILNDQPVIPPAAEYEFVYPTSIGQDDFADDSIDVDGYGTIPFKYFVKFRKRGDNLPAAKRGARIYCTNRLAGGPSLFSLPTGMHGFHNISYMECVVKADEFDRIGVDLINTNRTQLKEDNEAVAKLIERIVALMKEAVAKHAKFRDDEAEKEVKKSKAGTMLFKIIDRMPAKTRRPARVLINKLAAEHGADSVEFLELAPLVIDTMNASDVLIRLLEMGADAKSLPQVADALRELAEIEKSDALKLYRGRRDGIRALTGLINKGDDLWGKKGIEDELHALLKKAPWLIRPEFGRHVTSDQNLDVVYTRMARELGVDKFAKPESDGKSEESKKRPDLVFLMGNAHEPAEVIVVELKSPTIKLGQTHLTQLTTYMARVKDWLKTNYPETIPVRGFLIGRRALLSSDAEDAYALRNAEAERGPDSKWVVKDLEELVENAFRVHLVEIETLEAELPEESALKVPLKA